MFCENCGSKAIEGNRFCTTCGQARRSIPASDSVVSPSPELPKTPAEVSVRPDAVTSPSSADQLLGAVGLSSPPSEKALYCTHSPYERGTLGEAIRPGSDICYGCKLPYAPGSSNSGFRPVAEATTHAGVRDNVDALGNGLDADLTPQGGAGRHARWLLLIAALTALVAFSAP